MYVGCSSAGLFVCLFVCLSFLKHRVLFLCMLASRSVYNSVCSVCLYANMCLSPFPFISTASFGVFASLTIRLSGLCLPSLLFDFPICCSVFWIYLSSWLSVCSSVCRFVCSPLELSPPLKLSVCPSQLARLSFCPSALSVRLSVCRLVCHFHCLSVCLSPHMSVSASLCSPLQKCTYI